MYKQKIDSEFLPLKVVFPQCCFYLLSNNTSSFSITLVVREQYQERKVSSQMGAFLSVQLGQLI